MNDEKLNLFITFCESLSCVGLLTSGSDRQKFGWRAVFTPLERVSHQICRMVIATAAAQPIGSWIHEGHHIPFRALACPLKTV